MENITELQLQEQIEELKKTVDIKVSIPLSRFEGLIKAEAIVDVIRNSAINNKYIARKDILMILGINKSEVNDVEE